MSERLHAKKSDSLVPLQQRIQASADTILLNTDLWKGQTLGSPFFLLGFALTDNFFAAVVFCTAIGGSIRPHIQVVQSELNRRRANRRQETFYTRPHIRKTSTILFSAWDSGQIQSAKTVKRPVRDKSIFTYRTKH